MTVKSILVDITRLILIDNVDTTCTLVCTIYCSIFFNYSDDYFQNKNMQSRERTSTVVRNTDTSAVERLSTTTDTSAVERPSTTTDTSAVERLSTSSNMNDIYKSAGNANSSLLLFPHFIAMCSLLFLVFCIIVIVIIFVYI